MLENENFFRFDDHFDSLVFHSHFIKQRHFHYRRNCLDTIPDPIRKTRTATREEVFTQLPLRNFIQPVRSPNLT